MRIKISITLSKKLVKVIQKYGKAYDNRSEFIEAAIWAFIGQTIRERDNARDLEIINSKADELNAEADDVLAYQAPFRTEPYSRKKRAIFSR
ncbi:MAG: ribbon-helix-helix domain-containing protein [Anaerolineales bacterium]